MIYLASPYSHPDVRVRERRFREACSATARLVAAGLNVFSPIVHSHSIAHYGLPSSWEFWSRIDREFLSRCDVMAVLMLPGWRESVGVQAEIQFAANLGLPVLYVASAEQDDGGGVQQFLLEVSIYCLAEAQQA